MWGVPTDHKMFAEINTSQWMWYFYNYLEDKNERFTRNRDLVEYHASFIEPEAVQKIREARDNSVAVPDKEFTAGIEYFFGRKINLPEEKKTTTESVSIDPEVAIRKSNMYKKENKKVSHVIDYSYWLNMDLE